MKWVVALGATVLFALGLMVGCQEEEETQLFTNPPDSGYLSFPQDTSEIPDPDTLEDYPYDPNIFLIYTFEDLGLTEYPEPDSSEIDSADWPIWIPKAESTISIEEFVALERAILPETTMIRLAEEHPEYFEGEESPVLSPGNDCDFSNNRRGDIMLVRTPPCFWGRHNHAGAWRGSTGDYIDREAISSYPSTGVTTEKGSNYNNYWKRCRVLRVNTSPHSTTFRLRAIDYCEDQIGKPYNINWFWKYDKKRFYCSQLCWAGYYRCGAKNPRIDIDIYCIHYIKYFGFVPDFHVAPDEIWINWRTYQIAKSSGIW